MIENIFINWLYDYIFKYFDLGLQNIYIDILIFIKYFG